jgi:hypothetical protein
MINQLLAWLFAALFSYPTAAQQGIRVPSLDEYCKLKPLTWRETVIYVDAALVQNQQQAAAFATMISQKIGLAPRERVRLFYVRSNSDAREIFNKCWPDLTADELQEQGRSSASWIDWAKQFADVSPEMKLKDTKDFFRLNIQNVLLSEISDRGQSAGAGAGAARPPIDFVRVLSADKNRLTASERVFRILIFSPMVSETMRERASAPQSPDMDEGDRIDNLIREYPINLHGAETFIWGLSDNLGAPLRTAEQYWIAYLQRGISNLKSFAPEFPIPEPTGVGEPNSFSGGWRSIQGNGRATMSIAVTPQGKLVSSWVTIQSATRSLAIPIEGTYQCRQARDCVLAAKVARAVPYLRKRPFFEEGDLVELSGDSTSLKGSIKPAGVVRFERSGPVEYQLDLRR